MKRWTTLAFLPVLLLWGCGSTSTTTSTEGTASTAETATQAAEAPTQLTFAFQRQKDPAKLKEDADALGAKLQEALGIPVSVVVPTAYSATVQALISNRADVAYMSSLPYLLAKREADIEILLVEERDGKTAYDSILVVPKDSPIQSIDQLRGKRMAFTSATSSSGYVFPYAYFVEKGFLEAGAKPDTFFGQTSFAGGYDQALTAVLRGQADVAAVSFYTMEGPTADKYLPAEDRAKLRVLARIPNVPTHLIAVRSTLPADTKAKVKQTLLDLAKNEPERLADVYGASRFVEAGEEHVRAAEDALKRTGLDPKSVVE